ncbi:hypothetical protein F4801DRAFT_537731 [Xylaria longipes]|nr:hypothetical protein F4801DRAFT_537731 [Xylaria longipes]
MLVAVRFLFLLFFASHLHSLLVGVGAGGGVVARSYGEHHNNYFPRRWAHRMQEGHSTRMCTTGKSTGYQTLIWHLVEQEAVLPCCSPNVRGSTPCRSRGYTVGYNLIASRLARYIVCRCSRHQHRSSAY